MKNYPDVFLNILDADLYSEFLFSIIIKPFPFREDVMLNFCKETGNILICHPVFKQYYIKPRSISSYKYLIIEDKEAKEFLELKQLLDITFNDYILNNKTTLRKV